jgi:hypothetical protein
MVIGVPRVDLIDVVIGVAHDPRGHGAREAHRLELEPGHRAVGIGQEDLIDRDADFFAGDCFAGDEMAGDEFLGEVLGHAAGFSACRRF